MSKLEVFKNKNVILTGHTGFKGSWLTAWLVCLGAKVTGISLSPPTSPSLFETLRLSNSIQDIRSDIRDYQQVEQIFSNIQPDFVFHLAAQPLVRLSFEEPQDTWSTNLIGTINVLNSLRNIKKSCVGVFITSDKCYENIEWIWGYKETDRLGGKDPYSASKAAAELAIRSYAKSYFGDKDSFIRIASARAGNVIGGGDWARDRIVPDCIKAWSSDQSVQIRNPNSTRPWQHVLEPLGGYLCLASKLKEESLLHAEPFNFGPDASMNHTVLDLVQSMSTNWDKVRWVNTQQDEAHTPEANLLKLNCDKALHYLNWQPTLNFPETTKMTIDWYKYFLSQEKDIIDFTNEQIFNFQKKAPWVLAGN